MSQRTEYFGKYILLEKLNAGGMAEVFLALSTGANGIGKFVAIKRILPQYSDNPEFIKMFRTEANIAVNLSHSNIVSIYEFGKFKDQLFLVMDYVEGRSLRQILNRLKKDARYFSTDQIVYMIKEIAAGLDHAHRCLDSATGKSLNLIHRDISPQNIMISFEAEVKIIDFGIARAESVASEATKVGTLKGKYGYMSPEQVEGLDIDLRTDIFSLGTILWELCAKDRLFIANNELNTLKKVRDCHIPSLRKVNPDIHPELERIIMKSLSKDRNKRYQNAADLSRDLNRFLNRQFPDFSSQDFATMMKSLYADKIIDVRKRQVEYFKIKAPDLHEFDSTNTDISLITTTNFNDLEPNLKNLASSSVEVDINTKAEKFNFSSASIRKLKNSKKNLKTRTNIEHIPEREKTKTSSRVHAFSRRATQTGIKHTDSKNDSASKNKKSSIFPQFAMSILVLVGAYFGYQHLNIKAKDQSSTVKKKAPQNIKSIAKNNNKTVNKANELTKKSLAKVQIKYPVIINSRPSGARIFINDKDTGKITPSRISVIQGKEINIRLEKKSYLSYTKNNISFEDGRARSISATLQRSAIGYIDINIDKPKNTQIYINGQKLDENEFPIRKYAVPAYKKLIIQAYNPIDRTFAEKVVKLRKGDRQKLNLILKKSARRPARAQD